MSTITTNSKNLFDVLRPLLPTGSDADEVRVRVTDDIIEIQVVKPQGAHQRDTGETVGQRRERILDKLRRRTVRGVGLSDWAVSREAMYSEDD